MLMQKPYSNAAMEYQRARSELPQRRPEKRKKRRPRNWVALGTKLTSKSLVGHAGPSCGGQHASPVKTASASRTGFGAHSNC